MESSPETDATYFVPPTCGLRSVQRLGTRRSNALARADSGLTDQEMLVLQSIAAGATNKEIADKLFWSEVTVKRKTQDIFEKLGVANRAQAVAEATKRGIL